jgi:hypothetical protein
MKITLWGEHCTGVMPHRGKKEDGMKHQKLKTFFLTVFIIILLVTVVPNASTITPGAPLAVILVSWLFARGFIASWKRATAKKTVKPA